MTTQDIWDKPIETKSRSPVEIVSDTKSQIIEKPKKIKPPPFFLSQTLMKDVIDHYGIVKDFCAKKIYHIRILKDFEQHITGPMLCGSFGETLCLGSGRGGYQTLDLPRKKIGGEKRIAQVRIETQATRFPIVMQQNMIHVVPEFNTQIPIYKKLNDKITCRGELDIFPTSVNRYNGITNKWELVLAIVDLKFTGSVRTTYGSFGWGSPKYMDHAQGDMYQWLVRDFDYELNVRMEPEFESRVGYKNVFSPAVLNMIKQDRIHFFYAVFGYNKPDLENEFLLLERTYYDPEQSNKHRPKEHIQRMNATMSELEIMKHNGWDTNPTTDNCKKCSVSKLNGGICEDYNKTNKV